MTVYVSGRREMELVEEKTHRIDELITNPRAAGLDLAPAVNSDWPVAQ